MRRVLLGLLITVLVVAAGVVAWFFWASRGGESAAVTAPPLETTTVLTTASPDAAGRTAPTSGATVFELTEGSTVRFEIDEELRGQPNHVVATNPEVAGQIEVDTDDLSQSRIGTIVVDAGSFETDSGLRDRAIRGPILDAQTNEVITFEPTAVEGLSGATAVGEPVTFTVTGDLTIREVSVPVTFEVTGTLVAPDRLEGTATATVNRTDFGLEIPSVPSVANVSEEVLIALDFVAVPAA